MEGAKKRFSLRGSGGSGALLESGFLGSRTVSEDIYIVKSLSVCSNLFWQPRRLIQVTRSMSAAGDFQSLVIIAASFWILRASTVGVWPGHGDLWHHLICLSRPLMTSKAAIVLVSFFCTLESPAPKQSETDLMLNVSFMDGVCSAWRLPISCLEAVAGRWSCYGPFEVAHSLSSLTSR